LTDALAELGASIVVLDLREAQCTEQTERISETYGVQAMPLAVDLANEREIRKAVHEVHQRFGRLDVIVNSAALVGTNDLAGWAVPLEEQSTETWRRALEVNLTACFSLVQEAAPYLKAAGHGSVINIGSIYGLVGPDLRLYEGTALGNPAAYAVSKAGLLQLTRWLATVLSPEIRVNMLTCGGIARSQPPAFRRAYESRTPLRRMATEDDMKGAVAYLAADLSRYVTGHNLVVDGGWTSW
jgi:NAD(P)-dependent dehydrogenase (short-subunit alcohol dehydrogenase family)